MSDEVLSLQEVNEIVLNKLQNCDNAIAKLYENHPNAHMIAMSIHQTLNNLINRTGFAIGLHRDQDTGKATKTTFDPVTKFMGEEISFHKSLNPADIEVTKDELDLYREKVDSLYLSIPGMRAEQVATEYNTQPQMQVIVRGVAKKAGVPNYDTEPITVPFIKTIVQFIDRKNKEALLAENAENALQQQLAYQDTKPKDDEIALTPAHLNAFPHLTALGLKEGDIVKKSALQPVTEITPDGKQVKEGDESEEEKEQEQKHTNVKKEKALDPVAKAVKHHNAQATIKGNPNPEVTANEQGKRVDVGLNKENKVK